MVFLCHTVRGKPIGTLPAKFLTKHSPQIFQPVIAWRGTQWPRRRPFFIRIMRGKHIGIGFFILHDQIGFRGVAAIAPWIDTKHINRWRTIDNPFSQLPARATGCGDTETMAFIQPEIRQIPGWPDNRTAIRCIGNRPVIDFLDTNLTKGWHTFHGRQNMRLQTFKIFLK